MTKEKKERGKKPSGGEVTVRRRQRPNEKKKAH